MTHFDLVVIGSGSGNSILTEKLSSRRTAIIEESTFGGTCLNVGCIPTKMYVYAADVAHTVGDSTRYGVDAHIDGVRWSDIRNRVFGRIDPISAGGREYRRTAERVTLFETHAEFTGPRRLALGTGEQVSADQVVIATGSRATVPDLIAGSGVRFHTSDTIMRLAQRPARLVIVGGGYIAAEFAHIFSALGTEVTLIVRGQALLTHLDEEISRRFTELARGRWDVRLGAELVSVAGHGDPDGTGGTGHLDGTGGTNGTGGRHGTGGGGGSNGIDDPAGPGGLTGADGPVRLGLADGTVVEADILLVATGRVPNSDRLNLEAAGVEVGPAGRIVVDAYQRTTAEGVWALGDVSSEHQLKHAANQDARIVAHNLAHPDQMQVSNHRAIPAAVFTKPQIASVGLTEQAARDAGVRYVSVVQDFGSTAYGWAMEDTTGICKLLADPGTGLLLGAHLLGPQSSILIQPLIQAMTFGQTVADVARGQYWIHPALTEVVENALLKLGIGSATGA